MGARGPSPGSYRGDRVIRGEGVSPIYPPPQGLRLAGPGSVQQPHTGQGEPPATRSALPLEGPSVGYPCGPSPGLPRRPVSPSHLGVQDGPLRRGDLTTRVSREHPLRHEVEQRQECVSGVLPPSSPTSCPARGWGLSDFLGAPSRGVRWRRPMRPSVRPPWRSTVAAALPVTSSGRRRRLTAPWPPSCRLLGRLPPSLTTLFTDSPGTSGGPWWNSGMRSSRDAAWSVYGRPSGPTTARCTPSPRGRQRTSPFSVARRTGGCVRCFAIWRSETSPRR